MIDGHQPVITHATAASGRSIPPRERQVAHVDRGCQGDDLCCRVQKNTSCHKRSKKQLPPGECSKIVRMFHLRRPKASEEKYLHDMPVVLLMVNHLSRAGLATERTSKQTTTTQHGVGRCVWPRSDKANRACDAHAKNTN